jgi:2-isopropylmalate synthase
LRESDFSKKIFIKEFFMEGKKIVIFDTTLRDGEQAPGFGMNHEEKIKMAKQLEALGVDIMEAGFPISSEGDYIAVKEVSKIIEKCAVAALARAKKEDIDRAWDAIKDAKKPIIHTFIATSDVHMKYKLKKTRTQVLNDAITAVRYAKLLTDNVEFSAEDAIRSDINFVCEVFEAVIDAGAKVVNFPDTVGYAMPYEFGELIKTVKEKVKNIDKAILSVHCHNDLGLAVANSLVAVLNGAGQIECTINGIGERAGNASLEEIVMSIKTRKDIFKNYSTNIVSEEIYRTSKLLCNITGMYLQRNKAIVGENAFAHEAGIHQDGVLKESLTYEIMTPQSVGIKQSILVLGKHSGRHALANRYKELGYELSKEQIDEVYKLFTQLADVKKEIFDDDLIAIVNNELSGIPQKYEFKKIQITSGTNIIPMATVELALGDEKIRDTGTGDGPVDAVFQTIEKITKMRGELIDYSLKSVTTGKDAVGEVIVRVLFGERPFVGRGASTDVIIASAKAYLDAVNRAIYSKTRT